MPTIASAANLALPSAGAKSNHSVALETLSGRKVAPMFLARTYVLTKLKGSHVLRTPQRVMHRLPVGRRRHHRRRRLARARGCWRCAVRDCACVAAASFRLANMKVWCHCVAEMTGFFLFCVYGPGSEPSAPFCCRFAPEESREASLERVVRLSSGAGGVPSPRFATAAPIVSYAFYQWF